MGSPGGVGGSSGSSNAGGASGGRGDNAPDNDRGGSNRNDRDSSSRDNNSRDNNNDRSVSSRSENGSDQRGMTGSERTATSSSFSDALSEAANSVGPDDDPSRADDGRENRTSNRGRGIADGIGSTLGGLTDPGNIDTDRTADDAAQTAARESHPANEFSGLGASGGPVDNSLSGVESLNSHRGYGPDETMAGGIDDGVNAGLAAARENHPANEFSGLDASGGPRGSVAGGIDEDVNAGLAMDKTGMFDRPLALDIAGWGAAGVAGGIAISSQVVNLRAINSVADTLGRHPTGNLPTHRGSTVSNAEYAAELRKNGKRAADALANHPAKSGAMRGILEDAASTASKRGWTATGIGLAFDPVVTGTVAAVTAEGDWTDKATAAFMEGAKRIDNAFVSFGAGAVAAGGTMFGTAGAGTLAAPAAGAFVGVAAGEAYSRVGPDAWIDDKIEHIRPGVEAVFDGIDSAFDVSIDVAREITIQFGSGLQAIVDLASGDDDQPADSDLNVAP